jgi:hypothetical protein
MGSSKNESSVCMRMSLYPQLEIVIVRNIWMQPCNLMTTYKEQIHRLSSSEHFLLVFTLCISFFISRDIRWTENVKHIEKVRNAYRILFGKPERRVQLKKIDVSGSIILVWVLKE